MMCARCGGQVIVQWVASKPHVACSRCDMEWPIRGLVTRITYPYDVIGLRVESSPIVMLPHNPARAIDGDEE